MRTMTQAIIDRIRAEASNSPSEICGALIGDGTAVTTALALANHSVSTHDSFYIPAAEVLRMERAADLAGNMLMGFYHSHPKGDAVPSARDVHEAVPSYVYWIISGSGDVRAWRLRDDRSRFDEVDVVTRGDD
jgi:proteasome lid subunit RPN8/RPN11